MKILHGSGGTVNKFPENSTTTQLSLSFSLPHFDNLKEAVEYAITTSGRSRKYIAADLAFTEAQLSMMLSEYEGRNFPLYRLPDLIRALGDRGKVIVEWLAREYLATPDERLSQAAATLVEFSKALPAIQKAAEFVMHAQGKKK